MNKTKNASKRDIAVYGKGSWWSGGVVVNISSLCVAGILSCLYAPIESTKDYVLD